jgi:phosphoribosylanthranilate isomerase
MRMLTQINEISTPSEAAALSELGVDHIGILVGDGTFPRELSLSSNAWPVATMTSVNGVLILGNRLGRSDALEDDRSCRKLER